ncbi:hypothetical protein [Neisseria weaveri]|nr:hypothetical protein [Neisseria weaveri]
MSKREKRQVTKEEAEARIIRQMLRNVDEATAKADLFKRDDNIVSLMGAYLPKRDKHYQDSAYNSRYNAAYGSVLNHAARYKHFGRTPEEINSYNRHVVTDIPKAIVNVGIGAYESAANLANGSVFAEDPAYARIGRIGYGIPEYGNALETVGSLGLGAYALGRGNLASKAHATTVESKQLNISIRRPTARQSEIDVGGNLPTNARAQVSFKNGKEVPYGTKGSVRPDWCIGNVCSIEVKNYDIHTNRVALVNSVSKQLIKKSHLPLGMKQEIWIDLRGQSSSIRDRVDIQNKIYKKSNGIIQIEDIKFMQ